MRDNWKSPTWQQLLAGEHYNTSLLNEPIDFVIDFAVAEEPKRESATARAMRRWFKQNPVECERRAISSASE